MWRVDDAAMAVPADVSAIIPRGGSAADRSKAALAVGACAGADRRDPDDTGLTLLPAPAATAGWPAPDRIFSRFFGADRREATYMAKLLAEFQEAYPLVSLGVVVRPADGSLWGGFRPFVAAGESDQLNAPAFDPHDRAWQPVADSATW